MSVYPIPEQSPAERFAETMVGHLHGAAVTMMTTIGHRTGLFDTLAKLPPSSSIEIAVAAGLTERYVREWLAAMVTARIVEYDESANTYSLPEEHAQSLTRAYSGGNLATFAQLLTTLARVEDALVDAFQHGNGVRYSDFPRIDEVMAEETSQKLPLVIDPMLQVMPSLVERLRAGIEVLDLGCGTGRATLLLAQRFPRSRFLGVDLSAPAIERARRDAARLRTPNVRFELRDAADLQERDRFGLAVTFDAIHDQANPQKVLDNIYRSLRPSGVYIMAEPDSSSLLHENFEHPLATLLYTVSTFHCTTVSLARNGEGLGTMWGRQNASLFLARAGFASVRIERHDADVLNAYFYATKGTLS
ncbi:MAG TPA: class I SAM-dependent methyltransferase [Thermoanaerobaculia bacterium]|jgi:SAM-dependent methyltransferase